MRIVIVAVAVTAMLASQARAADAELSIDTKRMLAYGTLAVMTGACKTSMTPGQTIRMNSGLQKAADAQKQMSEADFTEVMKTVGAQVGGSKDEICAALTPEFIETSLEQAAAGE